METKVCKGCGRELPTTDFYTNNRAKDGLATYCKECANRLSTEYARKRREREKESGGKGERENRVREEVQGLHQSRTRQVYSTRVDA